MGVWSAVIGCGLAGLGLLFGVWLLLRELRYNKGRELVLNSFCYLQGIRPLWVRSAPIAHTILLSSASKGNCCEQLLSSRAWAPVLSLESVDGVQWVRMKKAFLTLHPHLPQPSTLTPIAHSLVQQRLSSGEEVDSKALVRLTLASVVKWLFDLDWKAEWEFLAEATWEWRKEIAIKGRGDMDLKLAAVDWMKGVIRGSRYWEVFGEEWEGAEFWSLFLQPFLISPSINISDIAVTLTSASFQAECSRIGHPLDPTQPLNDHLVFAISKSHPFPVLERWFPDGLSHPGGGWVVPPGTQVFLPTDAMGDSAEFGKTTWLAFGGGRRACAGRDVALSLCNGLLPPLLHHPLFRPHLNHLYSGRNNDGRDDLAGIWFQLQLMSSVFLALLKAKKVV